MGKDDFVIDRVDARRVGHESIGVCYPAGKKHGEQRRDIAFTPGRNPLGIEYRQSQTARSPEGLEQVEALEGESVEIIAGHNGLDSGRQSECFLEVFFGGFDAGELLDAFDDGRFRAMVFLDDFIETDGDKFNSIFIGDGLEVDVA